MNPTLPPPPSSVSNWLCCNVYHDRDELERIIQRLELSNVQKQIILSRYVHILDHLEKRVRTYNRVFYLGHTIITVGSLFVPALLSIQNSSTLTNSSNTIYWATFIISLLVTTFNGILTLFKIDKKYYFLNTTLERLRTEGWQYMGLTGRYSGQLTHGELPTHRNQFVYFTHQIEKIKMKQIEEEYYKSDEKTTQPPQHGTSTSTAIVPSHDLYPPSPDQPITSMVQQIPEPVKEAMYSLIRSQTTVRTPPMASPTVSPMVSPSTAPLENVVVIPDTTDSSVPTYQSTINLST